MEKPHLICPNCELKLYLSLDEIRYELYVYCWFCNNLFKNPNYCEDRTPVIFTERDAKLFRK